MFYFSASRQQAKLNICDDDDVTTTDIHMDGLLLSHSDYPWEYEVRNFVVGIHSANVCSKKLWLSEGWKLLVTIHDIDLAEGDSLIMRTSSKTIRYPNLTKSAQFLFEESDSYVQFEFKVSQESNGGKGFVVCFKRMCSKPCLKQPLKKNAKIGFQDRILLNAGQKRAFCNTFDLQ